MCLGLETAHSARRSGGAGGGVCLWDSFNGSDAAGVGGYTSSGPGCYSQVRSSGGDRVCALSKVGEVVGDALLPLVVHKGDTFALSEVTMVAFTMVGTRQQLQTLAVPHLVLQAAT